MKEEKLDWRSIPLSKEVNYTKIADEKYKILQKNDPVKRPKHEGVKGGIRARSMFSKGSF